MVVAKLVARVMLSLGALIVVCATVSAEPLYVIPSGGASCPDPLATCHTLNEYAANPNTYFTSIGTIDLILLPGDHNLTLTLSVSNITAPFTISAFDLTSQNPTVTCSDSMDANLRFVNVTQLVRISGIRFVGCVGNSFVSIGQLVVEDCEWDGQSRAGTGLELFLVANATITDTNFTLNTGNDINYLFGTSDSVQNSGGAMIANSSTVFISGCLFDGNTAHLGGAFYSAMSIITIHDCTFNNNFARDVGGGIYCGYTNLTLDNSTIINNTANGVKGYGGGIELILNTSARIYNCDLIGNKATFGGGIDVFRIKNDTIVLSDVRFVSNMADIGSALYSESSNIASDSLIIQYNMANTSVVEILLSNITIGGNTTITNNNGSFLAFVSDVVFSGITTFMYNSQPNSSELFREGGALTSFQSKIIFNDISVFMYNNAGFGGAISAKESEIYMYGDVIISHNKAFSDGGGIFLFQSELNFNGNVEISNNEAAMEGGGIHAVSARTRVTDGFVVLSKNSAKRGGGMYLELNAKLYVAKSLAECETGNLCAKRDNQTWIRLDLVENAADYGGALYVGDDTNSGTCDSIPFRVQSTASECFFQFLALHSVIDPNLNTRNTFFTNNSARVAGASLYGGLLDRCTVSSFSELFHVQEYSNLTPISVAAISAFVLGTNIQRNELSLQVNSDSTRVCFCDNNNQPDCNLKLPALRQRRGETFKVSLVAVDQVNNTVANTSVHGFLTDQVGLRRGQSIQNTSNTCSELTYNIFSPRKSEMLYVHANGPCDDTGISSSSIGIDFLPCPAGFKTNVSECDCDPVLYPEFVSSCFVDSSLLLRVKNIWISVLNTTKVDEEDRGYLTYTACPFDYCRLSDETVYIDLNVENGSDAQCAFNRSGILCGGCDHEQGFGLSLGSSRCLQCSNVGLALLIPFAMAGVLLVGFLLLCNLTVAVGTIDALIFYANIVGANRAAFLPFENTNVLSVFISWLNLDFGFDTCFYDGFDEYAKEWLQLAFPIYIIFLVGMVVLISKHNRFFAKLLSKRNPVATSATLILLSFTKLVRTVIAALSFGRIDVHVNGTVETKLVWLIDGNVPYFEGKHVPLAIAAIIILFVALTYSLLLFFWQWLLRCPNALLLRWIRNVRLSSFMDAYHAQFTRQHRYWTGLLLFVRVFLYLTTAFNVFGDPKIPLVSIVIVLVCLFLLKELVRGRIYKSRPLNALEGMFLCNLVIFAASTLYVRAIGNPQGFQISLAYVSTSIAFAMFVFILLYHLYTYLLSSCKPFRKLKESETMSGIKRISLVNTLEKSRSTDSSTKTEPLLESSGDYSKYRGPLELMDSESVSIGSHPTIQSTYKVKRGSEKKNRTIVTYSVVDAIPSDNKEQSMTDL